VKKVAFQGVEGAYSEVAARSYFKGKISPIACKEFTDVFHLVNNKRVAFGVLPIENSLTGSIHQNFDLLIRKRVWIVGEETLQIKHGLVAQKTSQIKKIKKVYSHPQALWQCQKFLRQLPKTQLIPYFDTAGSARFIRDQKDDKIAAVASPLAAKRYHLKVLSTGIEDHQHNFTRFIVIAAKNKPYRGKRCKTSIVFAVRSIPGALHRSLGAFADAGIQLIKLESRPIHGKPWEYRFYVDFEGADNTKNAQSALKNLKKTAKQIKVLGSYRAG